MTQEQLELQLANLEALIALLEQSTQDAPQGSLHVFSSHGSIQYSLRTASNAKDKYLKKKDMQAIKQIAQREYDEKLLKAALVKQKQLKACRPAFRDDVQTQPLREEGVFGQCGNAFADVGFSNITVIIDAGERPLLTSPRALPASLEQIFKTLPQAKKDLIDPRIEITSRFVQQWEDSFNPLYALPQSECRFETDKGHKVRSKSEVIIANKLFSEGIPYVYEQPVVVDGWTIHPDFLILNPRTYQEFIWEHFGLMDDPEYLNHALGKISSFASCGLTSKNNFIFTFESSAKPLDTRMLKFYIEQYLK